MKKIAKGIAILLIMGMMLILLTGCGNNKLVATKTIEDDTMGTYKEEVTMTFKDDKVTNIETNMEFEDEETASSMYALFSMAMSMSEDESTQAMEVRQDGKNLVITMDAETYAQSQEISEEDMTKDALKAELEAEGYTVK